jgi:hypothetical protein
LLLLAKESCLNPGYAFPQLSSTGGRPLVRYRGGSRPLLRSTREAADRHRPRHAHDHS